MHVPRRPGSEGSYSPRHSTGGFLGSRPARLVAAGLTVSLGVVGAAVLHEHREQRTSAVQAAPDSATSPTAALSPAPSSPSIPDVTPEPSSAPAGGASTSATPPAAPAADQAPAVSGTAVGQAGTSRGAVQDPQDASSRRRAQDPGDARGSVVPAAPDPVPAVPDPAPADPAPPAARQAPPVVAPAERLVLTVSVDVPGHVQVPPRSLQVHLPGPDPVEVTGSVTSPEPGRVDVGVTVDPGPRHVVEDPAPETAGVLAAALQRVARHAAAPAGQTPAVP